MLWNWQTPFLKFDRYADPSPSPSHVISATFKPKLSNRSSSTSTVQYLHLHPPPPVLSQPLARRETRLLTSSQPSSAIARLSLAAEVSCPAPNERTLQSPPTHERKLCLAYHRSSNQEWGSQGPEHPTQLRVSQSLSSPSSCNRRAFLSLVSVAWSLCAEFRGNQSGGFALLCWDDTEIRGRHHRPTPTNA
jgi:hypothetical protein